MTQTSVPAQPPARVCPSCNGSGQLAPVLIENLATGSKTMVTPPCLACTPW